MQKQSLKRRDFLRLGTQGLLTLGGLLGLSGLLRYLSYKPEPAPSPRISLGPAYGYPLGTRTIVADGQALLFHDETGLHAISLVCTHLGCLVQAQGSGFACPCHGSLYAADGSLIRGPASQSLSELILEQVENGDLILIKS